MSARSRAVAVIAVLVVAGLAVATLAPRITVPVRYDVSRVNEMQLNGGTLTLRRGPANEITARVPLTALPLLMVRLTDVDGGRVAEVGGFDDSDVRVVFFPLAAVDVPANVDDIEWTMTTDTLESVTVAGGTLVTKEYTAERLVVLGVAGEARLEGLDLDLLAIHSQDGSRITASGSADVLSVLDNAGGSVDTKQIRAGRTNPGPIHEILEEM